MRKLVQKAGSLLDRVRAYGRRLKRMRCGDPPRWTRGLVRVFQGADARIRRLVEGWNRFRRLRAQSREVPRILATMPEMAGSLESTMGEVEENFLNLGRELQSLSADANALAGRMRQSAQSIGRGDTGESFLENLDAVVRSALAELDDCRNGILENLNAIDAGLTHLGKLVTICTTIDQIGMSLSVVSFNIAVESSRSPEAQAMFEAFTDEIRKLSTRISRISQSILQDAGATRLRQSEAQDEILKGLFTFNKLNRSAQKVVEEAVEEIRDILELSMEALERSDRHSRDISDQIGEVVVSIQFHDIARQKIEHIAWALRDLAKDDSERPGEDGPAPWTAGRAGKVIGLQAAQLEEVVEEIQAARDKSDSAFHALDRLVERLVTDVSMSDEEGREEGRLQDRIGALQKGLEQLRDLLDQGRRLETRIQETAEQVSDTASSLSEHIDKVRSISMDLHLKALNAVVKSARLREEGRALEVLAQEVSKLSMQAEGFVTEVVDILQSLVALSLDLELGSWNDDETEEEDAIETGIRVVGQYNQQCRTETQAALEHSRALRSEIHRTGDGLDFLSTLSTRLSGYLDQIRQKGEALDARVDSEVEDADEALEQVARRYTMDSERQLHRQQIGGRQAVLSWPEETVEVLDSDELLFPELDSEKEEDTEADEDMGDNVELF